MSLKNGKSKKDATDGKLKNPAMSVAMEKAKSKPKPPSMLKKMKKKC